MPISLENFGFNHQLEENKMGPLVSFGIIGQEFNYIIALLIGLAFGYVLEQAGFSTSRKLVGVFYGYDFVVLRVFFTAAATALIGLIVFDYLGLVDMSYLYVNPTFLQPAIVGGIIMGLGFILGGFCPGTSLVAAATGKIDAMLFIVGSVIGIFIFGEIYPSIQDFYYSGDLGAIFVYDSLGISRGVFASGLAIIAIIAFIATTKIEEKVKYGYKPQHPKYKMAIPAIGIGFVIAIAIIFLPEEREGIESLSSTELEAELQGNIRYVAPEEIAYDIYNKTGKYLPIDMRSEEQFKKFCLTGASRMSFKDITLVQGQALLNHPSKSPVFYSENEELAKKAFLLAQEEGIKDVYILKGGIEKFKQMFYAGTATQNAAFIGSNSNDFSIRMANYLKSDTTLTKPQEKQKVEVKVVKVKGGC